MTTSRKKWMALFGLALFFTVQVAHTFLNHGNWPFSPYNMYHFMTPSRVVEPYARLYDDRGEMQLVRVETLIPVEFFRTRTMIRRGFRAEASTDDRERFARILLDRLNQGGWFPFDQISRPSLPPEGRKWVRLEVVQLASDLTTWSYAGPALEKELVNVLYPPAEQPR